MKKIIGYTLVTIPIAVAVIGMCAAFWRNTISTIITIVIGGILFVIFNTGMRLINKK